jgi:protoporphyrinogen oxidase
LSLISPDKSIASAALAPIDKGGPAVYHAGLRRTMAARGAMAVLGGGVAGLAIGLAAREAGLPFRIYERAERPGGNCVTFRHGEFRFDSGAHRFHGRDAAASLRLELLLGERLRRVSVPSLVRSDGRYLDFPFRAGDLAAKLGWPFLLRAAGEILASRLAIRDGSGDFAGLQKRRYGPTMAGAFLLNYSQKLWGLPGDRLSPEVAGDRLQGLRALSFLREKLLPRDLPASHLEGAFFYPDGGIGAISDALAGACGNENIRTAAEVTRVHHDRRRVLAVELASGETIPCSTLASTLPLDRFVGLLDPSPPADVLAAAVFRYRQLALAALFLDRETATTAATVYFPEPLFPFTRVCEPRNRSLLMAPPGQTSLVAEIPFSTGEPVAAMADGTLLDLVAGHLGQAGLIRSRDVRDGCVRRLADAYPVLEKGVEERRRRVCEFLGGFANLALGGRNGTFRYLHVHHLLAQAGPLLARLRPLAEAS